MCAASVANNVSAPAAAGVAGGYHLGLNEFLLAILSQLLFVSFFETPWHLQRRPPTAPAGAAAPAGGDGRPEARADGEFYRTT